MKDYEKEFCKEVINDTTQKGYDYYEVIEGMISKKFSDENDKIDFIKGLLDGTPNTAQIDGLIYIFLGGYDLCARLLGFDPESASEIEENRSKWEGSEYEDEFIEILEVLNGVEDDDDDDDDDW